MSDYKDPERMIDAIYNFADYIEGASEIGNTISLKKKYNLIQNIIVAGMGGSAIGGDICNMLLKNELSIPLYVCRNYTIPKWANTHTLVIVSSYSGDTEETLSAFEDAKSKECQIIGITTGGALSKRISDNSLDCIFMPSGLQPRAALAYSFVPMLYLLLKLELIKIDLLTNFFFPFLITNEPTNIHFLYFLANLLMPLKYSSLCIEVHCFKSCCLFNENKEETSGVKIKSVF